MPFVTQPGDQKHLSIKAHEVWQSHPCQLPKNTSDLTPLFYLCFFWWGFNGEMLFQTVADARRPKTAECVKVQRGKEKQSICTNHISKLFCWVSFFLSFFFSLGKVIVTVHIWNHLNHIFCCYIVILLPPPPKCVFVSTCCWRCVCVCVLFFLCWLKEVRSIIAVCMYLNDLSDHPALPLLLISAYVQAGCWCDIKYLTGPKRMFH